MAEKGKKCITPEEHRIQIEAFEKIRPSFTKYADVLKRVLEKACAVSIPEAIVQARAKAVTSFAEKCARKYDKYPDAVNQMTDLCGGRVIVQTIDQVMAVRQFIEDKFEIYEKDDKGLQLSEDKFGYRDMHYIIGLHEDHWKSLGITEEEEKTIGSLKAEVQVRTWVQHAWADTLHDRIYKNTLSIPMELKRTGALLAALMEEGDKNFNTIATELDGMVANYTAFAHRSDVEKEIAIQELIISNAPIEKKPELALKISKLHYACGNYDAVVTLLGPHNDLKGVNRGELLQYLGYALCKVNQVNPKSADYDRGLKFLEEALSFFGDIHPPYVLHLRKRQSFYARIHSLLGWAQSQILNNESTTREYKRKAYEYEPANPYYLADMLGYEINMTRQSDLPSAVRTIIQEAIITCINHAKAGIELPQAYFTAGRLSLLLDATMESLGYYSRGIQHCLAAEQVFPSDVLDEEIEWVKQLHVGNDAPEKCRWVCELLELAGRIQKIDNKKAAPDKVLIIVGGAISMDDKTLTDIRPYIQTALESFSGTVISGGTVVGIPGLVGEIASNLDSQKKKLFDLVSYIPDHLPHDGKKDERYDRFVVYGSDKFSPNQILCCWKNLLEQSIHPKDVQIFGVGGGQISALEYRLGLAFGASVAVLDGFKGASDELVHDALWSKLPNLLPIPFDIMSVRACIARTGVEFKESVLEEMAMAFHERYVSNSSGKLPDSMKPWANLDETYKHANTNQACYAIRILEACGFSVRENESPVIFKGFSDKEIEIMAEMEHGRWNMERLNDGWRFGQRDDALKLHNCIVPWSKLTEDIKKYDRDSVKKFSEILAKAKLEVYRK